MPPDTSRMFEPSSEGALRQGEILSDVLLYRRVIGGEKGEFEAERHPFVIVVSQDCDLDWDHKARHTTKEMKGKIVGSVLLCQVFDAVDVKKSASSSDHWKRIVQNKDERYQFLTTIPGDCDARGSGIGELTLDFKQYFTVPTDDLYDQLDGHAERRCRLLSPYLEHLCSRFAYFQNRVALPADHESEPDTKDR